jgi:hypothetical protein
LPRAGQFLAGVSLLAITLTAGGLGLSLNVVHGLETSLASGIAFGLADAARIIVPIICGLAGWSRQMRITAAFCVLVSLWSATNVYLDAAGCELLAKEHGATIYADADHHITELAEEAASLRFLAAKEGARGGCKQNCLALTSQAAEAAQRLQEARTRREGLHPVEASGFAAMAAMTYGGDPEKIARTLGAVKASLFIALVEILVWLAVPAMTLLGAAFHRRRRDVVDLQPIPARITAKSGSAAYYRQRLERDHPELARAVERGQLSTFAASVHAGLRKPAKGQALPSLAAPREALLLGQAAA